MAVFIFIFGLLIGSFLNVCIYRIPKEESIVFPPSHCTNCNHRINAYDLIPVVSYILLRGKCRYCNSKIALRYPVIELVTGMIVCLLYLRYGFGYEWIKYSLLSFWFIVIGMIDFDTTDIYSKTILSGLLIGLACIPIGAYFGQDFMGYLIGGVIGGGLIGIIILLTGGMGWGDAQAFLLGGIFIGFKLTLLALFTAFVLGGSMGILLILFKKKSRKDTIPFAPFISIAIIFATLCGDRIVQLYLR